MRKEPSMTSSQEDYLETIYHITAKKQAERVKGYHRSLRPARHFREPVPPP